MKAAFTKYVLMLILVLFLAALPAWAEAAVRDGAPTNVAAKQISMGNVKVTWRGKDKKYVVQMNEGSGEFHTCKTVTGTSVSVRSMFVPGQRYGFRVRAAGKGKEVWSKAVYLIGADRRMKLSLSRKNGGFLVSWSVLSGSPSYCLYRKEGEEGRYKTVTTLKNRTSYLDMDVKEGKTYFYRIRAKYNVSGNTYWSKASPEKCICLKNEKMMDPVKYRALVVGESSYEGEFLYGVKDARAMKTLFGMRGYACVTFCKNVSWSAVEERAMSTFRNADGNDVSVFYFSGHGSNDGSLLFVDDTFLTLEELREILDRVPGRKIVLLDSCGSGAGIYSGRGMAAAAGKAFSPRPSETSMVSSGEFLDGGEEYVVLTSCGYKEICFDSFGGLFTQTLVAGCGVDYLKLVENWDMAADANRDDRVTMAEIHSYLVRKLADDQTAVLYPKNSQLMLVER